MIFTFRHCALAIGTVATLGAWSAMTFPAQAADGFTDAQKAEMGEIIRAYILDNPQVIFEAVDKYKLKQEAESLQKAETSIKENIAFLTREDAPSVGNPKGDVTIVEFFDYNCGYCKRALPDIQKLIEEDKNLRVVFKEMPILGPTSRTTSLWALAANKQHKYWEFHIAAMEHQGPKDDAALEKIAKDVGLDIAQLKKDIESDAVKDELNKDMEIAGQIGVQGTPAFIIGMKFVPGYIGLDGLKDAVKEAREAAKDTTKDE